MPTVPFLGSYGDISGSGLMFRNKIINGDMYIWQRGVSFTPTTLATIYTADRWACFRAAFATGLLASRQTASGLANFPYALRVERSSGNAGTSYLSANQMIESITCNGLQGKTVTLSFYARVGSAFSAASSILTSSIITGTGTDQNVASGYAGEVTISKNHTVSTSWARFTHTVDIATSVNEINVRLSYIPTGTSAGSDWFEITGVQLETGQEATPFEQRPIGTELTLCQRYLAYFGGNNDTFPAYVITSATQALVVCTFPQPLRRAPASGDFTISAAGDMSCRLTNGGSTNATTVGFDGSSRYTASIIPGGMSGLVAGNATFARIQNNGFVYFSAEL